MRFTTLTITTYLLLGLFILGSCTYTQRLRLTKRYNKNNAFFAKSDLNKKQKAPHQELEPLPLSKKIQEAPVEEDFSLPVLVNKEIRLTKKDVPGLMQQTTASKSLQQKEKTPTILGMQGDKLRQLNLFSPEQITLPPAIIFEQRASSSWGKWRELPSDERLLLLVILAILIPPLAVYLYYRDFNIQFLINLILTLIFWFPGVIHALLVVFGIFD